MQNKITIGYLYPEYMNIYGDTGNIISLKTRAQQRGIDVNILPISINDPLKENLVDIYFFGGGQDEQQEHVSKDIQRLKDTIHSDIERGAAALTVCGGYQLFGNFYRPFSQNDLPGINIFPIETHASNIRMIGNIVVEIEKNLYQEMQGIYTKTQNIPKTLVGFENHSGQTITTSQSPLYLGKTISGFGNNDKKEYEGYHYKNAFGTYMHGSLLPKNPHFADYLIYKALEYRYQSAKKLVALNDEIEYKAHFAITK